MAHMLKMAGATVSYRVFQTHTMKSTGIMRRQFQTLDRHDILLGALADLLRRFGGTFRQYISYTLTLADLLRPSSAPLQYCPR